MALPLDPALPRSPESSALSLAAKGVILASSLEQEPDQDSRQARHQRDER
jgi:hypothetical protein